MPHPSSVKRISWLISRNLSTGDSTFCCTDVFIVLFILNHVRIWMNIWREWLKHHWLVMTAVKCNAVMCVNYNLVISARCGTFAVGTFIVLLLFLTFQKEESACFISQRLSCTVRCTVINIQTATDCGMTHRSLAAECIPHPNIHVIAVGFWVAEYALINIDKHWNWWQKYSDSKNDQNIPAWQMCNPGEFPECLHLNLVLLFIGDKDLI